MPSTSPSNCSHVHINSTLDNLYWYPPIKQNWNGILLGYNVTCLNNGTQISSSYWTTNSSIKLMDLLAHSFYICNISFVNEIGNGPPLTCEFYTSKL